MLTFFKGRCKSAFHAYLENVMDDVETNLLNKFSVKASSIMTNCTWEKFGDRMAMEGGRQFGLFDELMCFFASMNMYSSQKSNAAESKEGADFLQMYTGKCKTRETGKMYKYCVTLCFAL